MINAAFLQEAFYTAKADGVAVAAAAAAAKAEN